MSDITLDYDAFIRSVKRNKDVSHSCLFGAGTSISSGVQSATDCIWEWKSDIYLSKHPNAAPYYKNFKNESVRNAIQNWLDSEGIYPQLDSSQEYSFYAQEAYPIQEDRRKYFQQLVVGKEPYVGYKILCLLAGYGIIKAVWTTNFDGLVVKSAHQANLTPIEITLDNTTSIFRSSGAKELLTISLHGDYKYSTLKNTDKELDTQDAVFATTFTNFHSDRNLIVMGYSGRDKSLMEVLMNTYSQRGSGRLYWCGYGHEVSDGVKKLIEIARDSGREAYYIPTDGFDKTLLHLSKACFENDPTAEIEIDKILSTTQSDELTAAKFDFQLSRTDKYIKSNVHPITFPKEAFQFEIDFGDAKPWAFLKDKTRDKQITAVPFKRKVFALGTLSDINHVFRDCIKSEINRVPISRKDIEVVSAFKSLMLTSILKNLTSDDTLSSDFRDKLWLTTPQDTINKNEQVISIHKALFLSLFFDYHSNYAFLTLKPTVHFSSEDEISKDSKQSLGQAAMEAVKNKQYDELLDFWRNKLFKSKKVKFEFPEASGSGFYFAISHQSAYAEVMVMDANYRSYHPRNYDRRLTQHTGFQALEPQLIFTNTLTNQSFRDFHPMRALTNHKPYDSPLNGVIHSNQISLSIICPRKFATQLYTFLNGLHSLHRANVNTDYLIDYPGFSAAFNIPLNVPLTDDQYKWLDVDVDHFGSDLQEISIRLARLITSKIEHLANSQSQQTIVVFIPEEWQSYESYTNIGEKFDLHDYIKAFAASRGVSTQLIRESTINDGLKCQIYWWLSLSFYVKSLRTPWILNNANADTAYAGIGYSIKQTQNKADIVIGCSHIYNSSGQGLKYKLSKVDNFTLDKQNNPFLSYDESFQFGVSIRELFYTHMDKLPNRVVIHKRTRFTNEEVKGIVDSLNMAGIKNIDLIEINYESDVRYVATSIFSGVMNTDPFPVSRGTCIVTGKKTALLWTHGIVPSVQAPNRKYFLGGRSIPVPLKIVRHHGNSDIQTIATEILGLTKMNWNSFDLYTKLPATIDSSNQIAKIGKLLARFEGKTYDYRLFI